MSTNKKSKKDPAPSGKSETSKRNSVSSANKKVVTFNQTQISSQDNQSSDIHSKTSKPKSNASKKRSDEEMASSKQKSITSQDRYSRKSSKDSKKSKEAPSSSRRGKVSAHGSKKGELDSRNVDLPSQNDEALNIVIVKNSQEDNSIENAKDTINSSMKGSVEMNKTLPQGFGVDSSEPQSYEVNPDLNDPKVDQIASIPNMPLTLSVSEEVTPEVYLENKRAARKKQMAKRLDLIKRVEEQLRQASIQEPTPREQEPPKEEKAPKEDQPKHEEPPISKEPEAKKVEEAEISKDINQNSSNEEIEESENLKQQSQDGVEDEIELIKDQIEDNLPDVKVESKETDRADDNDYAQDEFESEKEVLHASVVSKDDKEKQAVNAPTVSILKQPETSTSVQKQASIKSKKTVCISEDPNHKKKSETKVRENSMDSQESFDPARSKDENSIISEEDSLFEDQTPHGRNPNIKDFDQSKVNIAHAEDQAQKQRRGSKRKQKRSLVKTKSMNEEDTLDQDIVQRKDKAIRQQTLQDKQNSENKTPMRHHQDKSKGVLSQLDQESVNVGRSKAGTTYISSKPEPGSKFIKKQTTQDEKRGRQKERNQRGTQDPKGSNDNSLNLTVDNQMDHLSVNFGFRQKNFNQSQDRDKELKAGTNSMYSSQIDEAQGHSNKRNNHMGSNQRKYQSNIRSASKGEGISFRSRDSIDQRSQSVGRDNSVYPYHTQKSVKISQNEDDEFDLRQEIQKANRKMVNIYLQKPYQVLSIQQIRQKDRGGNNNSPARLYHAENMLKVHTQYRPIEQGQKYARKGGASRARINESRQSKQGEKKSVSKDSRQSKVMVYNITWRSGGENQQDDYQPSDKAYDNSAIKTEHTSRERGLTNNMGQKKSITNRQHGASPADDKKNVVDVSSYSYLSGSDARLNYTTGLQPSSQQENYLSNGDRTNLEQVQEMIESKGFGSAMSVGTDRSNEKEFWSSLYNQLLQQLDRRIEVVQSQINFHSKTKNLCNIYGQKLDPIVFGNASYSPGLQKLEKMSPTKPKSKPLQKHQRHSNINAEFLQPLLAISKESLDDKINSPKVTSQQEIEQTLMNSQGSLNKVKMNKLNLQGLPDYNEQMTFEKVKKSDSNMVTNGEEGFVQSPNQDFDKTKILKAVGSGSTNLDHEQFISEVKNGGYILSEEGGSRMEDYGRSQEPDLLKLLLQNTEKMGYSHQQLKNLKEKKEKLMKVEKALMRQNQIKLATKAKNQSAEQAQFQQMQFRGGDSFDLNNREIKSFYHEPQPPGKLRKDLKKHNIHSNLQLNKQMYANKLNEHMIPRSNFVTQKLNSQQKSKHQQSPGHLEDAFQNEVETVEDYFGNKVSMRRSIELKLHYDPKGFRKSGNRNRNAIQQNIQSNDQVLADSKDMHVIQVSQINRKGYETAGRNSKSHATGKVLGKTTNFIENNKVNVFPGQILNNLERNRAALPNISTGKYKSRQSQKNNDYLKRMSFDHDMTVGEANIQSRRNQDSSNVNTHNYNNILTPQKEQKSPIRNQKSRFIEENQKQSKKRLIQSGHQVLGRSSHAQNSGIHIDNGQNNILNHQFKNVSPRLPNFKNNFQRSQEQNYEESMFNIQFTSKNYQNNPMPNGNTSSVISSQYGAASRFNQTKQSMILQGFLNQQRIFNRMINNAGIQQHRSNNASKLGMQTGYSSNNEFSDLSNTQKHNFGQLLRNSEMGQNMHHEPHESNEFLNEATPKSGDDTAAQLQPRPAIVQSQNEAVARQRQTAQQVEAAVNDLEGLAQNQSQAQPGQ